MTDSNSASAGREAESSIQCLLFAQLKCWYNQAVASSYVSSAQEKYAVPATSNFPYPALIFPADARVSECLHQLLYLCSIVLLLVLQNKIQSAVFKKLKQANGICTASSRSEQQLLSFPRSCRILFISGICPIICSLTAQGRQTRFHFIDRNPFLPFENFSVTTNCFIGCQQGRGR